MSRAQAPTPSLHPDLRKLIQHAIWYTEELPAYLASKDDAEVCYAMNNLLDEIGTLGEGGEKVFPKWFPYIAHVLKNTKNQVVFSNAFLVLVYFTSSPQVVENILTDGTLCQLFYNILFQDTNGAEETKLQDILKTQEVVIDIFFNIALYVNIEEISKNPLAFSNYNKIPEILRTFYSLLQSKTIKSQTEGEIIKKILATLNYLEPSSEKTVMVRPKRPALIYDIEMCLCSTNERIRSQAITYVMNGLQSENLLDQINSFRNLKKHFRIFEDLDPTSSLPLIETLLAQLHSPHPEIYNSALQTLSALACEENRAAIILDRIPRDILFLFFIDKNADSRNAAASFLLACSSSEAGLKKFVEKFPKIISQLPAFFIKESNTHVLARYLKCVKNFLTHNPELKESFCENTQLLPKLMTIIECYSSNPLQKDATEIFNLLQPVDQTPAHRPRA